VYRINQLADDYVVNPADIPRARLSC